MKRSIKDTVKIVLYTMLGEGQFNPALLTSVAVFFAGILLLAWISGFDFEATLLLSVTSLSPLLINWSLAVFLRSIAAQMILIASSLLYLYLFWKACQSPERGFVLLTLALVLGLLLILLGLAAALIEWITRMINKRRA